MTNPAVSPVSGHGRTLPDLSFACHGSVWLLQPHSDAGREWIAEHIPDDAMTFGAGFAVERYVDDIANGAMADGLTVGGNW